MATSRSQTLPVGPSPALLRATHRALLAAEASTLSSLRAASGRALDDLLRPLSLSSPAGAHRLVLAASRPVTARLRADVVAAVQGGRGAARRAALQRLAAELGRHAPPPPPSDAAEDHPRAESAADSYTAAWRTAVTGALRSGGEEDPARALRRAADAQDHRLRRIAATEVPAAYSDEHRAASESVVERHPSLALLLVRVWDATLDRRVCPVCRRMDGAWALVGRPFRGGLEPGAVHPYCRCVPTLLVMKPGVLIPGAAYAGALAAA